MTKKFQRIYIFDFIRGIAITGVILLHTIQHEWTGSTAVETGTQDPSTLVQILFYILTMAGLFYIVSGSVNAFSMYKRIKQGKNTIKQMQKSGLILGLFLLAAHYIFRGLLSASSGILYYYIRTGEYHPPSSEKLIGTSTLAMLGWIAILLPLVLGMLFRKEGYKKAKRNYLILIGTGTLILILTPLIRDAFARDVVQFIDEGKYLRAVLLGAFVYDLFPIFPYFAYSLFGAALGIALARKEKRSRILASLIIMGIIWLTTGIIGVNAFGGLDPTLYRTFSSQAIYNKTFMQISQVGLFMFLLAAGLQFFDFVLPEVKKQRTKYFGLFKRFGMISLTIFLFEGFITVILKRIADAIPFLEGWSDNLGLVALLGLINVILWDLASRWWKKNEYVGSIEWLVVRMVRWFSGKQSQKLNFGKIVSKTVKNVKDIFEPKKEKNRK